MKCRSCGSENVHRSRLRNSRERLIAMATPFRAYRCHDCNQRQMMRKREVASVPSRADSRKRMRNLMLFLKIVAIILAIAAGIYIVAAPYLDLARPISPHSK